MRTRRSISTLLCFWMVFASLAYCVDASEKEKAATEAAMPWLDLVDSGQYGDSWFQAASVILQCCLKGTMDEQDALGTRSFWQGGYAQA